jgi:mannosyltransferase OCH1-like enzyme
VLYAFGGFYIDDDSYIETSLEQVVMPNDTLILSQETNEYIDDCYESNFHLSHDHLTRTHRYHNFKSLYGNKVLVNWGIFSAPGHPVIRQVMENLVDIIRREFIRRSVVHLRWRDEQWKVIMCATGPMMMTASVREMTIAHAGNLSVRVTSADFKEYGGVFKVKEGQPSVHYKNVMKKNHSPLLRQYLPSIEVLSDNIL